MPIATVNPSTGELVKSFEPLTDAELEAKLQKAADTFVTYRNISFAERARMMMKAAAIIDAEKENYARVMTPEMGKTYRSAVDEAEKCARMPLLRGKCREIPGRRTGKQRSEQSTYAINRWAWCSR